MSKADFLIRKMDKILDGIRHSGYGNVNWSANVLFYN